MRFRNWLTGSSYQSGRQTLRVGESADLVYGLSQVRAKLKLQSFSESREFRSVLAGSKGSRAGPYLLISTRGIFSAKAWAFKAGW